MAALPDLITVAQLDQLPDRGDVRYELHHGEVVAVTVPKLNHVKLQLLLRDLLQARLRTFGAVAVECPYRPVAEYEFRTADVAAVSWSRWHSATEYLFGAPELVIEVKSPSNTKAQLRELVTLCLNHGAVECWIIEPKKKSVTVVRRGEGPHVYGAGTEVPLGAFGAGSLPVDEIFAES